VRGLAALPKGKAKRHAALRGACRRPAMPMAALHEGIRWRFRQLWVCTVPSKPWENKHIGDRRMLRSTRRFVRRCER
jgi:hypothetical protein